MSRHQHIYSLALVIVLAMCANGQENHPKPDLRGSVSKDNVYTNPALGMTINLPGEWQLLDATSETPNDPSCTGPLCGPPDVNVILESKPGYRLYLSGWKLSANISIAAVIR